MRCAHCLGAVLLVAIVSCRSEERPEALAGAWYGVDSSQSGGRYEHVKLSLLEDGRATLFRQRRENEQWLPRRSASYQSWTVGASGAGRESFCLQSEPRSAKRCGALAARSRTSMTIELPVDSHPASALRAIKLDRVVPPVAH